MTRRGLFLIVCVLALAAPVAAPANSPPVPEVNFAHTLTPSPCTSDPGNVYEAAQYQLEGWPETAPGVFERYPGACQRLHFAFGPIHVKPGQNDVLIQPITIEKPAYDGYITRFKPDLVRADGSVPPIEELHLHHGTWISLSGYFTDATEPIQNGIHNGGGPDTHPYVDGRDYGSGPFFASGEEKTIGDLPRGYGFPVLASDTWQLLYMVHNITPRPDEVWITYDVDYVAKAVAESPSVGLKAAYPLWMDVRPSSYPVFNVQRGFNDANLGGATGECTWPKNKCARFNSWGATEVGQGLPGNGLGSDIRLPQLGDPFGRVASFKGGTIIGLGGHLHPGGKHVDVELVRGGTNGSSQRIFTSDAEYWQLGSPVGGGVAGGAPTSWDLSMTVTGIPRWAVHVNPGDILRLNATYDSTVQSTYENMGIVVAFISPDNADGSAIEPGALDPLAVAPDHVDDSLNCDSGGFRNGYLCLRGVVTHGHMAEANNHGGSNAQPLTGAMSSHADHVAIAGFAYAPGDFSTVGALGIPTVSKGSAVKFVNFDAFADVYHTVTSCAYPCTGSTGIAFPLSDGSGSLGTQVDFDSAELGYGPNVAGGTLAFGPAKNALDWDLSIDSAYQSGELYTYFCRIHPSMRGVFAVE